MLGSGLLEYVCEPHRLLLDLKGTQNELLLDYEKLTIFEETNNGKFEAAKTLKPKLRSALLHVKSITVPLISSVKRPLLVKEILTLTSVISKI